MLKSFDQFFKKMLEGKLEHDPVPVLEHETFTHAHMLHLSQGKGEREWYKEV